jgi:hypothetical protein
VRHTAGVPATWNRPRVSVEHDVGGQERAWHVVGQQRKIEQHRGQVEVGGGDDGQNARAIGDRT